MIYYEQYDIVVNPVVAEPLVQLTYKIQMKFMFKNNDSNTKNQVLLLGINGQLQKVDLRNT